MSNNKKKNRKANTKKSLKFQGKTYSFSGKELTSYGGMPFVKDALESYGLRKWCYWNMMHLDSYAEIGTSHLIEQIVSTMIIGGNRISDTKLLKEKSLVDLFGWKRIPDDSMYSRRFREISSDEVEEFRKWQREKTTEKINAEELFITIDATVETVCGSQEGAAIGYNPNKPGRKSYHPFVAYEYGSRSIIDAILRPGNTNSLTDLDSFIKPLFKLRKAGMLTFRLDKGCTSNKILELIEGVGHKYVAKAKMYPTVWEKIQEIETWDALDDRHFIGEFERDGRRYVVIEELKNVSGEQQNLWGFVESKYSIVVSNRNDDAATIWRYYNKGAMVETGIKELKNDLSGIDFRTQSFDANQMFLFCGVLAYNVANILRSSPAMGDDRHCQMKKLRLILLSIAAKIVRHGRETLIRLNSEHAFQKIFIQMWHFRFG